MGRSRKLKTYRKEAKRQISAIMAAQAQELNDAIRPKPRWMPWWAWKLGARLYFKLPQDAHKKT